MSVEIEQSDQKKDAIVEVHNLTFNYGDYTALHDITIDIYKNEVTSLIGPSGCGKSTFLRCMNRMNDLIESSKVSSGYIRIDGVDINLRNIDVTALRRRVGMVFQKSNPFAKSIYDNVAYGLRIQGEKRKSVLDTVVETALKDVALWDEVKDRLSDSGLSLSGGQQQRLCIARALAVKPQILLLDEPCSALDPIGTASIEELIHKLKEQYTIIIVTHNMQQAARVSDRTAFFNLGRLIEFDRTDDIFMNPKNSQTEAYISGRFG